MITSPTSGHFREDAKAVFAAMAFSFAFIDVEEQGVEQALARLRFEWQPFTITYRPKPSWQRAGGHYGRAHRAARREALRALLAWGFTEEQAKLTIQQADDMAELERNAR